MLQQLIWLERIVKKQPINLTSMPTVNQKYKTRTSVHIISTFQTVVPASTACLYYRTTYIVVVPAKAATTKTVSSKGIGSTRYVRGILNDSLDLIAILAYLPTTNQPTCLPAAQVVYTHMGQTPRLNFGEDSNVHFVSWLDDAVSPNPITTEDELHVTKFMRSIFARDRGLFVVVMNHLWTRTTEYRPGQAVYWPGLVILNHPPTNCNTFVTFNWLVFANEIRANGVRLLSLWVDWRSFTYPPTIQTCF